METFLQREHLPKEEVRFSGFWPFTEQHDISPFNLTDPGNRKHVKAPSVCANIFH